MWPHGERGQAIQIGAVLLFGALILALAGYQAFVVPAQNERVEFVHSQTVQDHMSDLRNAIVSAPGGQTPRSVSVQLGTQYPARAVAINPGPPTGQLRTTGTDDPSVEFGLDNVDATGETGDFWDGSTRTYRTGGLFYRPNYNVYTRAPTTAYESSVLYNEFPSGTVALSDQTLVDGTRITLVALNGSYDATKAGTVSPDVRPLSSSTRTVTVSDDGDPIELTLPTKLDEDTWEELLDEEIDSGHVVDGSVSVTDTGGEFETLSLELETGQQYTLQMAKVGVGTDVTETDEAYMTNVSKSGSTVPEDGSELLVVEVRDEYNNPVSGVTVSADAATGSLDDTTAQTGPDGRAAFLYDAPASVSSLTEDTVNFSYTGAPGTGFDAAEPENVNMTVEVQNTEAGGSGGGSTPFDVAWDDPDGGSNKRYEFDVEAEGATTDLTALVENTSLTSAAIDDAEVDFAVNDSTIGTVSPGTDATGSSGEATTTLSAQSNGLVRVYATTGGGASDYLDVNISNAGSATPVADGGVVYAGQNNGELSTVDTGGNIVNYGVTSVTATGPVEFDFVGGGDTEVPYIDGNGNLGVANGSDSVTLVDSNSYSPGISSSKRLAVGQAYVDGSGKYRTDGGPFVYFINGNDKLARVDGSGNVEVIDDNTGQPLIDTAQAVMGTGDIDDDGTVELIYVNSNSNFEYVESGPGNNAETTVLGSSPTLNTPNAVGEPADFDDDGADEIPYIDGDDDNTMKYVNGDGAGDTAGSTTEVVRNLNNEIPVGVADRDADDDLEIAYVDSTGDDRLVYFDLDGTRTFVTDSNGDEVGAKTNTGAS
ncbi:hypothetical protein BRC64_01250 [Halobacteriales archaeon QH_10_67_22]|nr:MAG: hypothetical protein BRC64_01250 [Halobacteriales archaeon QH_10_67_22]